MSDVNLKELSEKLGELLEQNEDMTVFDEHEVITLRKMITIMKRFEALGWFGQKAFYIIVSLGILITNWDKIIAYISKLVGAG
jgi:hypothetical protein